MDIDHREGFEKVYSFDWYDGPRSGVAEFNGKPYYFESQWEDINTDNPDSFKLSPIAEELLPLVIRSWELWRKWQEAHYQGLTTPGSNPFSPEDAVERQRLDQILKAKLIIDEANYLGVKAEFEPVEMMPKRDYGIKDLVVKWKTSEDE